MKTLTRVTLFSLLALGLMLGASANAQDGLSGDEILQRASEKGLFSVDGSVISDIRFELTFEDGSTEIRTFAILAKTVPNEPERSLVYFKRPELECGTIFLTIDPVESDADKNLWLKLAGVNQVKELVSESDRNSSFAGSNLENDQVGGNDLSADYTATRENEATVDVTWRGERQARNAYVLSLELRPESNEEFPTGTVWVDTETFNVLKAELNNDAGVLEQTVNNDQFVDFNVEIVPNSSEISNVLDGSQTLITSEERRRPDNPLPNEVFTADELPDFDPSAYSIDSPCT